MPALEVVPPSLVSAAAAVRCFSLELEPVVLGSGSLLGTIGGGFDARWGQTLRALSADADTTALALRDAAADYVRLDRDLVPR